MTLAAIRAGVIATLVDSGKWTNAQVSACDFGIAEQSACSVILQPGADSRFELLNFGTFGPAACGARDKIRSWRINGILLIKDRGDPKLLLGDLWKGADDLYTALSADDTFNGSACSGQLETISRPAIDAFVESAGADYGFLTFSILASEW